MRIPISATVSTAIGSACLRSYVAAAAITDVSAADEVLEKHGPGLLHQRSGTFQLSPAFGLLIAVCRQEQHIGANNASEAFRYPGMTLGRNLDGLIDSDEGIRIITFKEVGVCQIGQNAGFVL